LFVCNRAWTLFGILKHSEWKRSPVTKSLSYCKETIPVGKENLHHLGLLKCKFLKRKRFLCSETLETFKIVTGHISACVHMYVCMTLLLKKQWIEIWLDLCKPIFLWSAESVSLEENRPILKFRGYSSVLPHYLNIEIFSCPLGNRIIINVISTTIG
jgi:hypothetical protein